jgi:hypothetical protein
MTKFRHSTTLFRIADTWYRSGNGRKSTALHATAKHTNRKGNEPKTPGILTLNLENSHGSAFMAANR